MCDRRPPGSGRTIQSHCAERRRDVRGSLLLSWCSLTPRGKAWRLPRGLWVVGFKQNGRRPQRGTPRPRRNHVPGNRPRSTRRGQHDAKEACGRSSQGQGNARTGQACENRRSSARSILRRRSLAGVPANLGALGKAHFHFPCETVAAMQSVRCHRTPNRLPTTGKVSAEERDRGTTTVKNPPCSINRTLRMRPSDTRT